MFKVGSYVVYKKNVCLVNDIKKRKKGNYEYYSLAPLSDQSLTIEIPVENKGEFIRELIDKKEIKKLLNMIPEIEVITATGHSIEAEYKTLLNSMKHEDLIKIIKTVYKRNEERLEAGKKLSEKDNTYFQKAEQLLCNEFSIVLGNNFEDIQNQLLEKLSIK